MQERNRTVVYLQSEKVRKRGFEFLRSENTPGIDYGALAKIQNLEICGGGGHCTS